MIEGYEVVESLSDNYSLVKDDSRDFCYGIFEHSSNTIIGFKYYKIKRTSSRFLLGKEKYGSNTDLLTATGTIVDHVSFGSYEFIGMYKGLSIFYRKMHGDKCKTVLILETYKDRVSGEMFTYKVMYTAENNEELKFNGIEVYPPANRFTDSFKRRRETIRTKALNRFKNRTSNLST